MYSIEPWFNPIVKPHNSTNHFHTSIAHLFSTRNVICSMFPLACEIMTRYMLHEKEKVHRHTRQVDTTTRPLFNWKPRETFESNQLKSKRIDKKHDRIQTRKNKCVIILTIDLHVFYIRRLSLNNYCPWLKENNNNHKYLHCVCLRALRI
jgi:hypothetical protein